MQSCPIIVRGFLNILKRITHRCVVGPLPFIDTSCAVVLAVHNGTTAARLLLARGTATIHENRKPPPSTSPLGTRRHRVSSLASVTPVSSPAFRVRISHARTKVFREHFADRDFSDTSYPVSS